MYLIMCINFTWFDLVLQILETNNEIYILITYSSGKVNTNLGIQAYTTQIQMA